MLRLRNATSRDVTVILSLVRELAIYEREPRAASATASDLRRDGFSKRRKFRAIIAEWDGKPAGMVLFFPYYSTWRGRSGIFVEDLIVKNRFRGKGVGLALMSRVARIALEEGGTGMRWEVYSWNKEAIRFYRKIGALFRQQGRVMRLTEEDLLKLSKTKVALKQK